MCNKIHCRKCNTNMHCFYILSVVIHYGNLHDYSTTRTYKKENYMFTIDRPRTLLNTNHARTLVVKIIISLQAANNSSTR